MYDVVCVNFSLSIGLSVLDLGPMYATDRQTDRRQTVSSLNAPPRWRGHNNNTYKQPTGPAQQFVYVVKMLRTSLTVVRICD